MATFMQSFNASGAQSPRETIAGFLKRNAGLIIGVSLFVTFWMLVYTFAVYKPEYAAKSMVIIKDSAITGRYIEPDQYYALQTTSSSSSNPVLNTMGLLESGAIRDDLWVYFQSKHPEQLKKLKIKTKKQWDAFYQDGSSMIKAKNQTGTDLIAVEFAWNDPAIAREALGVVLTAFQNASRDLNRSEQSTRTRFLDQQVREIEDQLADIRRQKSVYQNENHTVSLKREGDDLAGSRMELSNRLSQIEAQAQGKEKLARRYQQLLGMNPEKALKASALGQNSSMARLQDELYRLQQQYSLMTSSLTETNPKVKEIEAQIQQVENNLEAERTRTLGADSIGKGQPVVADSSRNDLVKAMLVAHGEAQDLRAQASVIRTRLGQINTDISDFPQKAEGLAKIEQKEASLSVALDNLRQKTLENRLKEEQTLSNVFIVDQPRLPDKANFPNRNHLVVLSLLMGLGVGLASAFAKEQLSSSRQYGLPEWLEPLEQNDDDNNVAPETQPQPQIPASSNVVLQPPPQVTVLNNEPIAEKVELPVVGSLFDSLVPVAGPMLRQQQNQQPEIRRDLTRPLSQQPDVIPEMTHPVVNPLAQPEPAPTAEQPIPAILRPDFEIQEEHLMPPEVITPARSVRMAPTPSPVTVAQAQAEHQAKTALPLSEQEGIPTMHVAPEITPVEIMPAPPAATPTPEPVELDSERPITHEPISYKAPAQVNVVAESPLEETITEAPVSESSEADEHAVSLYEEQARKMPLPRRVRGVPAFLLGQETEENETRQPYTLVPKKQLLSPGDDLTQDMAPLEAPVQAPEESDYQPFPDEITGESFRPRKPLIKPIFFGKKPNRNPEAYFGLGNPKQRKRSELPTSLNRLMASIQGHPAKYDA